MRTDYIDLYQRTPDRKVAALRGTPGRHPVHQSNPLQRRRHNDHFFDVVQVPEPLAKDRSVTLSKHALA